MDGEGINNNGVNLAIAIGVKCLEAEGCLVSVRVRGGSSYSSVESAEVACTSIVVEVIKSCASNGGVDLVGGTVEGELRGCCKAGVVKGSLRELTDNACENNRGLVGIYAVNLNVAVYILGEEDFNVHHEVVGVINVAINSGGKASISYVFYKSAGEGSVIVLINAVIGNIFKLSKSCFEVKLLGSDVLIGVEPVGLSDLAVSVLLPRKLHHTAKNAVVDKLSSVVTRESFACVQTAEVCIETCLVGFDVNTGFPSRTGEAEYVSLVVHSNKHHLCCLAAGYGSVGSEGAVTHTGNDAEGGAVLNVACCPVILRISKLAAACIV